MRGHGGFHLDDFFTNIRFLEEPLTSLAGDDEPLGYPVGQTFPDFSQARHLLAHHVTHLLVYFRQRYGQGGIRNFPFVQQGVIHCGMDFFEDDKEREVSVFGNEVQVEENAFHGFFQSVGQPAQILHIKKKIPPETFFGLGHQFEHAIILAKEGLEFLNFGAQYIDSSLLMAPREKTPPFHDQSAGLPFYQCALPLPKPKITPVRRPATIATITERQPYRRL